MDKELTIRLTFLEPYRLVDYGDEKFTKIKDRGRSFTRWRERKDEKGWEPIITGTLLRSATVRAAEEILSICGGKWDGIECCNGEFDTDPKKFDTDPKKKDPKKFRKRPTLKWSDRKACGKCPFCNFLKTKDPATDNHLISFGNLVLDGKRDFNKDYLKEIASQRVLNRIDSKAGKAFDYFKVYEVEDKEFWKYQGNITINDNVDSRAIELLKDSLKFIDRLCGALCIIKVGDKPCEESSIFPSPSSLTANEEKSCLKTPIDVTTINDIGKNLSDIFEDPNNLDKLRILADAVRAMRLKTPEIIKNLPIGKKGKDEGVHFLWDKIKFNNKNAREILEEAITKDKIKANWRDFCEFLGQYLYDRYKEKTGGKVVRERLLGDTEYYSKQAEAGAITRIDDGRNVKEWIFVGELKTKTPFFFGTEAKGGDQTSISILLDKKTRRYRIPRSVLRGVLRDDLRFAFEGSGCEVKLGLPHPCECPVCMIMRRITIMDSKSDFCEPPEIRQRIRRNPYTGVVDEGALFDIEVGPEGIEFHFVMRYRGDETKPPSELTDVLYAWTQDEAFLGGSSSTGKGRFSLQNLVYFEWNLKTDLDRYIDKRGFRDVTEPEDLKKALTDIGEPNGITSSNKYKPQWTKVKYKIEVKSPLLSADPIEALLDKENYDSVVYQKRVIECTDPIPTYKGESIRGLVRTAFGRQILKKVNEEYLSLLELEHEDCTCELCKVFGNEHEAGKIRFEDLCIENANERRMDHVAIDRFTGGAAEQKKFDDYPLAGSPNKHIVLKGQFWLRHDLTGGDKEKIADALCDIRNGLYPLGGKGGVGYGWVEDVELIEPTSNFSLPPRKEPKEDTAIESQPFDYPPQPELKLDKDAVYYPHYFLKPHKKVIRDKRLIGHEKFQKDLYTGKIECTLKTLTPLIIPDSENVTEDANGHKAYRFFRINSKEMIPGSEIRGPISSAYEALTNSCFRVFDEGRYLSRRVRPKKGDRFSNLKQGRVVKDEKGDLVIKEVKDVYRLPLYDNEDVIRDISGVYNEKSKDDEKLKNAIEWNKRVAEIADMNRTFIKSKGQEEMKGILSGMKEITFKIDEERDNPNDPIALLCEDDCKDGKKGYIKFTGLNMVLKGKGGSSSIVPLDGTDVMSLTILHNRYMERRPPNSSNKYPRGVLQFVEDEFLYTIPKHCERVFASPEDEAKIHTVPFKVKNQYKDVLADCARNLGRIDERCLTIVQHKELTEGDLVYFLPSNSNPEEVEAIMPVTISRTTDSKPLGKRFFEDESLSNDLRPCEREILEDIDTSLLANFTEKMLFRRHEKGLCPACRLFGTTGYKGRVKFGFAEHVGELKLIKNGDGSPINYLTLPLLEKPRPTWSMPNDSAPVPGRKFYVHHNGWKKEVVGKQDELTKNRTENNRTVEPLAEGNEFKFEVFFENLKPWELGLLLYSLELEEGMAHKIGMAKAFGFGSVEITVDEISLLKASGDWQDKTLLEEGFGKLEEWFGGRDGKKWHEIHHIKNLREQLLRIPENIGECQVKYPELEEYEVLKDNGFNKKTENFIVPWTEWTLTKSPVESESSSGVSASPAKMKGTVKWFDESKGYGFIKQENGKDVFVHCSAIIGEGFRTLKEGDRVKFNTREGEKGQQACDVEIV